ncbi:hypothetical protein BDN70DRAFT_883713 [Pholiota conissans]|uniref:Uncharacterized protein n=1 Tax=Pholiota conissans TaxID=109636 RepID=A0A9P6CQU8_9AGAR|nr:hypothetical protein BDN70DRAFT_883713 [Pholiota conissans]
MYMEAAVHTRRRRTPPKRSQKMEYRRRFIVSPSGLGEACYTDPHPPTRPWASSSSSETKRDAIHR